MVFLEFHILLNHHFLSFPSYKQLLTCTAFCYNHLQAWTIFSSNTLPFPNYFSPAPLPSLHLPTHSQCPFISLFLCVLFSATVIITSRSSKLFNSVSPTDSKAAALHFINLSLPVRLGKRDKLGKRQSACRMHGWADDEEDDVRYGQGLMQVNPIKEK